MSLVCVGNLQKQGTALPFSQWLKLYKHNLHKILFQNDLVHGSKNIASTTTVDKYFETKLKKVITKNPIGDDCYSGLVSMIYNFVDNKKEKPDHRR